VAAQLLVPIIPSPIVTILTFQQKFGGNSGKTHFLMNLATKVKDKNDARFRSQTMTAHILLVEDEVKLARFVELELSSEGYQVSVAHDGMTGLALARESELDLAILDWMLPGLTGVELCRRLRATGSKVPVILLTARDEVVDRVTGLDAGADDYVVKPFSIEELLARIRAHLRRTQESDQDVLQFEDLSLNRCTREVFRGRRAIELTAKEFDLLEYLLNHPRQVYTRDQILEKVWGYDFMGDSNIIEVYVRYLRLKLEEQGEKRLIHTVRGVGYALRE
jgi:DNA-binding response OmpR family regulator